MVARAFSGIHVIAVWSYLNPAAFFNASFVVFMTGYHLLLSLVLELDGIEGNRDVLRAYSKEPADANESTAIFTSRSTSTSMISPILASDGS